MSLLQSTALPRLIDNLCKNRSIAVKTAWKVQEEEVAPLSPNDLLMPATKYVKRLSQKYENNDSMDDESTESDNFYMGVGLPKKQKSTPYAPPGHKDTFPSIVKVSKVTNDLIRDAHDDMNVQSPELFDAKHASTESRRKRMIHEAQNRCRQDDQAKKMKETYDKNIPLMWM